jgi:2'-5' RNA ligase
MDKLYFALQPDMDASDEILDVARGIAFEYDLVEPYRPEWLHLSLNGVGHFSLELADRAIAVGDSIWAPPVEVTLNQIALYNGDPRALVFEASATEPLQKLFDMLATSMVQNGLGAGKQFAPHVTMLKDNRAPPQVPLARPIRWTAEEFVLIHSNDWLFEVVASWRLLG